jgi:hypothetical protein
MDFSPILIAGKNLSTFMTEHILHITRLIHTKFK